MKIATRAAYGEALAELAEAYPQLVVLDADLSGSTLSTPLPCSPQVVPGSRCAIPSLIPV